jgi:hypothetical protein
VPSPAAWKPRDTAIAVALFLGSAAFTLWQNSRIGVLWDISYLLDTSFRITLGQILYKDLPFAHAPLTFLIHAAIIKLFGRVYFPHIAFAALESGAATVLTWRILLNLLQQKQPQRQEKLHPQEILTQHQEVATLANPESPRLSLAPTRTSNWLLATLLAVPLTVIGIYAVYPHPIYDSDCILSVLVVLYLLQRAGNSRTLSALAGAVCVLPPFFKQNIGLPFLAIVILAVLTIAIIRRLQRTSISPQLWFFAGSAVALAIALILIHTLVGIHNYIDWTMTFAAQRRLPGLGLILDTYRQTSLLWTVPAAAAGLLLLRSNSLRAKRWTRPSAILLLAVPFLWTIAALVLTNDADDRAEQLLSLWPHLLILAAVLAVYVLRPRSLYADPSINTLLPVILLATIQGTFLSQQLWGSSYAIWPLLTILVAAMLAQIPTIAGPLATIIAATFLLCGGLYSTSLERLSYIHLDGVQTRATLPELRGLTTPGPWIPDFEELVHFSDTEIPRGDGILIIPGEVPFYFATGRAPRFPILIFDPATDPYTPQQTLDQARAHNIRWLIVTRNLQLTGPPHPDLPAILSTVRHDFIPYRTLTNYDIYRHK